MLQKLLHFIAVLSISASFELLSASNPAPAQRYVQKTGVVTYSKVLLDLNVSTYTLIKTVCVYRNITLVTGNETLRRNVKII